MKLPVRMQLAHLPTPIYKLKSVPGVPEGINIYIKRDDYSGMELSGNKVRKLEYIAQDALEKGETVLITCGGLQSNHCRATAAVAAQLGLKCHLLVSGTGPDGLGNNVLDQILGAKITYVPSEDFGNYMEIMKSLQLQYEAENEKARIIPVGASTPLGTFGYYSAYCEILEQEETMNLEFDTIVTAVGSAGTYAGLWLGHAAHDTCKSIVGINIYSSDLNYDKLVRKLAGGAAEIAGMVYRENDPVHIINHVHTGYGQISDPAAEFIKAFAMRQGMILDPVYTGKAFHGMVQEIINENPHISGNVLFIHTGGMYGALARTEVYL